MSRTFTHARTGIVVEYPNATHFAFVPAIIKATGIPAEYDGLGVTVHDPATGTRYHEEREPLHCAVHFDIRRYLQLLFGDTEHSRIAYGQAFVDSPLERTAEVTVYWSGGTSRQELLTFAMDAIWGAVSARESSGGIMRRRWFVRYPFSVDVYARNGTSFDVQVDGRRSDLMFYCHEADAAGATPYHRYLLDPARLLNAAAIDRTVHLAVPHSLVLKDDDEAVGMVAYTLDVDRSAEGVYLRWIDRQGRYSYYLFREVGSAATMTASAWERSGTGVPTAYAGGVNVETPVRQTLTRRRTRTLGAKLVDRETYDFLLTLAQSVVVDAFDGWDADGAPRWHRVNVVAGGYEKTPKHYQDFVCSIEEPAQDAQML